MSLHTPFIILRIIAFAALGVLGVFIFGVDPATLNIAGHGFFFFSVWLLVASSVALGLLSLARRFLDESAVRAYLPAALRQGVLIGAYVVGIALTQFLGYLTWWIALLVLAFLLLIEFTARQLHRS